MFKYFPSLIKYKKYIFCENAGGSQIPNQIIDSFTKFVTNNYVQPGANNILSKNISNELNNIDNVVNMILNNKSGDIIYGSSCTQIVYNLANSMENHLKINKKNTSTLPWALDSSDNNLSLKSEIILSNFSHESCITPFERIAQKNDIKINWWKLEEKDNKYDLDYKLLLDKVNSNTKLVVIPHVSNILGNVIDIEYLNNEIKSINPDTKILVDGVAYMPHKLIDVEKYNVDFYVVSFYKFCGLRISAMYIKNKDYDIFKNQNHYFFDNNDNIRKNLELGGMNFETASSILGLKQYFIDYAILHNYFKDINKNSFNRKLIEFVMDKIENYEKTLTKIMQKKLNDNNEIELIECDNLEKLPIFSIRFKNYNENNVNLILNSLGLICKNGTFYCDRLFNSLDIDKSRGVLRLSFLHYNTLSEIKTVSKYINLFKKYDYKFNYSVDYTLKNNISDKLINSFDILPIDNFYSNKRYRAFSLLKVDNLNTENMVEIVDDLNFYQPITYNDSNNGGIIREYSNINNTVIEDMTFKNFLKIFINTVEKNMSTKCDFIQLHQIRVYCDKVTNKLPEGIHKDGFNMIGILCITRENIKNDNNKIYDNNKKIVFNRQLEPGEFLIINDNKHYHEITEFNLENQFDIGYRDIFVFTTIS